MRRRLILAMAAIACGACLRVLAAGAEVTVFAAASLSDALREVGAAWEKETGDKVRFNFAASSLLARQIEAGAPADIFFSADEARMDAVESKGLVVPGTRRRLLGNTLVVVVPKDGATVEVKRIEDLANAKVTKVALGDPASVPAGVYAQVYLRKKRLWEAVSPKVVPMDNVRAALAAVESGNVDAGIVYKTDAGISKRVKVAVEVAEAEGPPIIYPAALLKDAPQAEAARRFLERLGSREAAAVFERFGFAAAPGGSGGN
jgi:molybdate transport system substrate-binding protein